MASRIQIKVFQTVGGGAVVIAFASIFSKVLGFLRDRLLASYFGADRVLDMYYTAFKLPDFIFNVLVLGALSSSFVPVFVEYWQKKKGEKDAEKDSWMLTNTVLHLMFVSLSVFCVFGFIFAEFMVKVLAPGFSPEEITTTAALTRIMLFSVVFFGLSNVVSGVLNSVRRFVAYSIAPIMYNIGIIFGIVVLYPLLDIYGLAVGAVLGAFLHLSVQIPSFVRVGYRYNPHIRISHKGIAQIWKLMIPRTFGLGIGQINYMVTNAVASTLAAGSITVYNLAFNLQSLPVSIFSVSLAVSAFPVFSEAFLQKKYDRFVFHFSQTVRRILYFILPSSIFILLLRAQLVRIVFGSGSFDWADTIMTAQVLGYFALSLFAQGLIPVLARSFYALQDSRTPVITAFISMALNIVLAMILAPYFGVIGLALAFAVANTLNMMVLFIILRVRIGKLNDENIVNSVLKILSAALFAGLFTRLSMEIVSRMVNMQTFLGILCQTSISLGVGGVVYLLLTRYLELPEVKLFEKYIKVLYRKIVRKRKAL